MILKIFGVAVVELAVYAALRRTHPEFAVLTEIAAAVRHGKARLEQIALAEGLCIDKLVCLLAMRKEEETDPVRRNVIDRQAHELLSYLKRYPSYREPARIMEWHWDNGNIMQIYR